MTIEEFTNGSVVHGVFSVAIRNHKMFLWLGPALVGFILPNLKEAIAHYMAIFKSHVPPNKPLFYTKGLGNKLGLSMLFKS